MHWKGIFFEKKNENTQLIAIGRKILILFLNLVNISRCGQFRQKKKHSHAALQGSEILPKMHCKGTFFTDQELHCQGPILKAGFWAAHAVVQRSIVVQRSRLNIHSINQKIQYCINKEQKTAIKIDFLKISLFLTYNNKRKSTHHIVNFCNHKKTLCRPQPIRLFYFIFKKNLH